MNKRLVSIIGMAFATAAALAVESTNVVGYMDVASASYKLVTPTFTQVGGGTSFTLADIRPTNDASWDFNSDRIFCYNGALRAFIATYLTAAQAQEIINDSGVEATAVDGWYDFTDVQEWGETGSLKCYNNTSINFASSGFAVESAVGVRFSGEVKASNQTIASASYKLVGNCSASNLTLADIEPADKAAWDFNSDRIFCYNGALRAFIATYLTAAQAQEIINDSGVEATAVDGWYDFTDVQEWGETGSLKCYNSTAVPAGTGFAVESAVGVVIPSAL